MTHSQDIKLTPGECLSVTWAKVNEYATTRHGELSRKLLSCSNWDEYVSVRAKLQEVTMLLGLQEKQEIEND